MRFRYLLYILLLNGGLIAQKPFVVHGTPLNTEGVNIDSLTLFYEDTTEQPLSFQQIQSTPSLFRPFIEKRNERTSTNDVTTLRVWLKFSIKNTHAADTAHLIWSPNEHRRIFFYQKNQVVKKAGTHYFNEYITRNSEFIHLVVAPNTTDTLHAEIVDFKFSVMPVGSRLFTNYAALYQFAENIYNIPLLFLLLSVFVGCLLFMVLYSLYHFWLTKDSVFGFYALYATATMIIIELGIESRFGFAYLSHLFTFNLSNDGGFEVAGFNFILPVLYILFVSKIINIPKNNPRLWLFLKGAMLILVLQQCLTYYQSFTMHYFYKNTYYRYENSITFGSTSLLAYTTWRSNYPVKKYILAGIFCFILLIIFPLSLSFIRPDWFFNGKLNRHPDWEAVINFIPFWSYLGLTLEALCFALALAYRSYLIELENKNMQKNYTNNLEKELAKRSEEIKKQSKILEEERIKQLEASFEQRLAETEMAALRAQMNPHFIFNCLNSIKLYTLENDSVTASEYLSKFSRLIRMVLENSRSEKITLEDEIETLRLYMDMEAMRFKNKVQYRIEIEEKIDMNFIEIPPLLLQPYVENAIWHGLMHKKNGGTIQLKATQPNDNLLEVAIIDDGIGRKAAAERKSKSATKHKSMGMKMTTERIELINQKFQNQTQVEVIDLVDTEGGVVGTKVIVKIPI